MEYKAVIATVETWINLYSLLNFYDIPRIVLIQQEKKIHRFEGTHKALLHGIHHQELFLTNLTQCFPQEKYWNTFLHMYFFF